MKKLSRLMVGVLSFAVYAAFGYGDEDVLGAWANESDPTHACVVVTNATVWRLEGDVWRPTFHLVPEEHGVRFYPTDLNRLDEGYAIFKPNGPMQKDKLTKRGFKDVDNDVYYANSTKGLGIIDCGTAVRMVRAPMPNWSLPKSFSSYVGTWKPISVTKLHEQKEKCKVITGEELQKQGMLVKIRDDHNAVFARLGDLRSGKGGQLTFVRQFVESEGWLRLCESDKRKRKAGQPATFDDRGHKRAFWLAPDGHLRFYATDEIVEFERTTEAIDDPIDHNLRMVREKKIQGTWGVNSEFNIFVLQFDAGGKGIVSGFMVIVPFDWTVGEDGVIACSLDAEIVGVANKGGKQVLPPVVRCIYDPIGDTMTVLDIKDPNTGTPRVIDLISRDVHVREALDAMQKVKSNKAKRSGMRE